ncbi:MAG TPA: hypothetical protein VGQ72_11470 [Pyrinomonadaceae bacterium]|jgi:hypothetical protein|nr:hypothetical protein [Pyrinomonadaceae bacterium]
MSRHESHKANFIFLAATVCALLFLACSKTGGNSIHVKSPAVGDKDIAIKSAFADPVTKTFTDITGKMSTAVVYNLHAANYDLDAGRFGASLNNPLPSDDSVRVMFSLVGEEGTKEASPLKAGTYSAKADKYMKVETVGIVTRKGGTEIKNWLDRSTLNGQVKITSVSDDSASGDIDVTAGDSTIKGSFTAKILKRK